MLIMLLNSGISQHSLTLDTRHLSHTPLEGRSVRHIIVYISKDFLPAMVDIMTKIGDKINFKYHIPGNFFVSKFLRKWRFQ